MSKGSAVDLSPTMLIVLGACARTGAVTGRKAATGAAKHRASAANFMAAA